MLAHKFDSSQYGFGFIASESMRPAYSIACLVAKDLGLKLAPVVRIFRPADREPGFTYKSDIHGLQVAGERMEVLGKQAPVIRVRERRISDMAKTVAHECRQALKNSPKPSAILE